MWPVPIVLYSCTNRYAIVRSAPFLVQVTSLSSQPFDLKRVALCARSPSMVMFFGLALTGCAVGPDYHRPNAPSVDRYTTQSLPAHTVSTEVGNGDAQRFLQGRDVPARWWTTFDNDELTRRVNIALANSPSVASAQAALRQAQ